MPQVTLSELVTALREGTALASFPTDTVPALAARPDRAGAIYETKQRDFSKPLILMGARPEDLWPYVVDRDGNQEQWQAIARDYWPGALTIVLPALPRVRPEVTGGGATVGLRVPDHPVPRALARALGGAVTGTSANRSGNPGAWQSAEEIVREFTGEVDWVVWDGPAPEAPAAARAPGSTVVRVADEGVSVLREGAIPFAEILDFLKEE